MSETATTIVERLRAPKPCDKNGDDGLPGYVSILFHQSAAEIERLQARVKVLEDAAWKAANIVNVNLYHQREKVEDAVSILRAALSHTSEGS